MFASRRVCEKMGLAPNRNGENAGKSAVAKVPVPIFSQPRRIGWIVVGVLTLIRVCLVSHSLADDRADWLTAVQQQTATAADPATDAAGGVDGVINGLFGFHTGQERSPWWQVDLGDVQPLDRVVIYNRTAVPDRVSRVTVLLSDDGQRWTEAYRHDGTVFFGHSDGKPLNVRLEARRARYVRLQVPDDTWLHLDEVQVFGGGDSGRNLALNRPAAQSSVSSWSTRKETAAVAEVEPLVDVPRGQQVIRGLLNSCGRSGEPLQQRLQALADTGTQLDDAAWVELYSAARQLRDRIVALRDEWSRLDVTALRLAIDDLSQTFPERYTAGAACLEEFQRREPDFAALTEGLQQGDPLAVDQVERLLALRRDALLANPLLDFGRLLLVKRPAAAPQWGLPANFQGNDSLPRTGFDDELAVLSPLQPDGTLTTVLGPEKNFVGDVDLDFDGQRLLFSSLNEQRRWRVYELELGGTVPVPVFRAEKRDWLRASPNADARPIKSGTVPVPVFRQIPQIDETDVDNFDACYLPGGDIVFTSTATYIGVPCVFGGSHVSNLYHLNRATGDIRRLTYDQDHNWCPTVLPNGRVMFLRWEYADLAHSNSRLLFSMNPDGTNQMEYYGSNSYFPTSFFYARPLADGTSRVAGIATGHHGTRRSGRLLILDPARGRQEADGVVQEIPGRDRPVEATVRDRLVDGVWPQFIHPYPLTEPGSSRGAGKYFLVSARLSPNAPWGIYLADVFDNLTLVKQLPGYALFEPVPLQAVPQPPVIQPRIDPAESEATVYVVDVHQGGGLDGVPRGEVKQLRLFTYYYSSRGTGGLLGSVGMDGPWDVRRVLGTVPVEEDGSALFRVPANQPIAVQPLDGEGKALQLMRSWFTAMPGEMLSCVGCHEKQNDATVNRATVAMSRLPSPIQPWYGPQRGFSFAHEVQPVLDRHCVTCHDGGQAEPDLRGTAMIDDWNSQIAGHVNPKHGGRFSVAYANLHGFVRRPGIESDLHMLSPLDFHADTTELVQILRKGHHGVRLDQESWDRLVTWIDLNAPYHGNWSGIVGEAHIAAVVQRRRELERQYGGPDIDYEDMGQLARLATTAPPAAPPTIDPPGDPASVPAVEGWPFDAAEAARRQRAAGPAATRTIDLGDGVTMTLALVPAGQFVMGGGDGHPDERPAHAVRIDRPFWIGTCEVTNAQFVRFDPRHDSRLESRHGYQFGRLGYPLNEPQQPVVRVSWQQAMAFGNWLSDRTGLHCTLPTEAQWEYACRAGTASPFSFGERDTDFSTWANLGDRRLREYAACTAHEGYSGTRILPDPNRYDDWVPKDDRFDDGHFLAAAVGQYQANAWGLHDMHGNVWEWTRSSDVTYPYRDDDGRNDAEPSGRKIVRGGSWYDRPYRATSSYRLGYRPYQRVFNVGFRIVMEAAPEVARAK
jgi:formylglycine-generating enzyme required for sulfatase activity